MKKISVYLISVFIMICLAGCTSKEPIEYVQSKLSEPDYIELRQDDSIVTYEKGSEKYDVIYEARVKGYTKP